MTYLVITSMEQRPNVDGHTTTGWLMSICAAMLISGCILPPFSDPKYPTELDKTVANVRAQGAARAETNTERRERYERQMAELKAKREKEPPIKMVNVTFTGPACVYPINLVQLLNSADPHRTLIENPMYCDVRGYGGNSWGLECRGCSMFYGQKGITTEEALADSHPHVGVGTDVPFTTGPQHLKLVVRKSDVTQLSRFQIQP